MHEARYRLAGAILVNLHTVRRVAPISGEHVAFYNGRRPHQALRDRTPMAVWREGVTGMLDDTAVDMTLRLDNARALPTCPQPPQQQQVNMA
jgi:hypothetical protein